MIIASAQTIPKSTTEENISDHHRLAKVASENGASLIIFPEMSLTGYLMETADELAFEEKDTRLGALRELAVENNISIIAGAPLNLETGLHIGSFVIAADGSLSVYTKKFLHGPEAKFFVPGTYPDKQLTLEGEITSLAICADISNPLHPANAAKAGATLYLASIFYTPGGIDEAYRDLPSYARSFGFDVLMSNFGGASYGYDSAGKSAFWNKEGNLVGGFEGPGEGLLIAVKHDNEWTCKILTDTDNGN
jgi:predicted amidohydrolase